MQSPPSASQAPSLNATQVSTDQTKSNVNTANTQAFLNNVNQVTPTGSLTYDVTGGHTDYNGNWSPEFTATQNLSPAYQKLFDQTTGLANNTLGQVGNAINTPLNFSGAPALPGNQDQLRSDAYNALTARSTEDLQRAGNAQDVQLANQGIQPGSEAWNRAQELQGRAITDASNQATIQAGNVAGQNLEQAQTLRNQYINETEAQRNQPLLDYQSLLGLNGGVSQQNFTTTPQTQVNPTDTQSPQIAAYQGASNSYNLAQQTATASNNALLGGLFNLGGTALGAYALGGLKR